MKRSYAHLPRHLNSVKEQALLGLYQPFHKALGAVQATVRRRILEGGGIPRWPAMPDGRTIGGLSARQMKSVGNMVRNAHMAWQAQLEDKVRHIISHSRLAPHLRTILHRLNKRHLWFHKDATLTWARDESGRMTPAPRRGRGVVELPAEPSALRLLRRIAKHCMKRCPMPDLRRVDTLILDSIIAKPSRPTTTADPATSWWVKITTMRRNHPVQVPLTRNPHFEKAYETATRAGGGMCGVIQLTRSDGRIAKLSLVLERPDAPLRADGTTLGIDWGIADALMATSDGNLLGHAMLDRLREYDTQLTRRGQWMRRRGLKPTDDPYYRRLQNRIRSFVTNEIGRLLNRIAAREGTGRVREIIVERLDFRHGGMSPRMNRLVTRAGRATLRRRLESLTETHGVAATGVPSQYTSLECSGCGYASRRNRPSRGTFHCGFCGLMLHADVNAARVILSRRSWHQPDGMGPTARNDTLLLLERRHRQRWGLPDGWSGPGRRRRSGPSTTPHSGGVGDGSLPNATK